MVKILVYRPEGNLGPYSEFDLRSMIQSGLIKPSELGWQEGMTKWQPISTFVPLSTPPPIAAFPGAVNVTSTLSTDDATRREYLKAESNIRSIGILYYLGSIIVTLAAAAILFHNSHQAHPPALQTILPFTLFGMAVVYLWLARRIQQLKPVVVIPATIVACLGILAFPVGTIVNAIILYLLHCPKGHLVFTPQYQALVARTPHIICQTSWVMKLFLIVLLLVMAGFIAILSVNVR